MSESIRTTGRRLAIVVAAGILAACGNLVAGGIGEVTVTITGDDPTTAQTQAASAGARSQAASAEARAPAASDHEDDPEGELEAEFELFLEAEDGGRIALTPNGPIRVRVDLEGVENPEIANRTVDATRYTSLRMVFVEIDVEVEAGLIINGVPFVGSVRVELEDSTLTVSRPLDLDVQPDESVSLQIDLNAADWLQALDPATAAIDAQVFADLVIVSVR